MSEAADIWSFGVLTWALACVMRPFDGHPATRVALDIVSGEMRPSMPASAPPALKEIVELCCQDDASRRPSASALVALLEAAAGGGGGGGGASGAAAGGGGRAISSIAATPDTRPLRDATLMRPGGVGWRGESFGSTDDARSAGSGRTGTRTELSEAGAVPTDGSGGGAGRGRAGQQQPRRHRGSTGSIRVAGPPPQTADELDAHPIMSSTVDSNAYSLLPRD